MTELSESKKGENALRILSDAGRLTHGRIAEFKDGLRPPGGKASKAEIAEQFGLGVDDVEHVIAQHAVELEAKGQGELADEIRAKALELFGE
jgi:hypothetical protein